MGQSDETEAPNVDPNVDPDGALLHAPGNWWAELHLQAFLSLTIADRKVERREMVWVKRFFLRHHRLDFYTRFESLVRDVEGTYDAAKMERLARIAREQMSQGDRRAFINNLAQMCKAKGSIADEEYESILEFADRVGLEDVDADSIINSVFSINDTFSAIVGVLALGIILYFTRVVVVPLVIAIFIAMIIRRLDGTVRSVLRLERLSWLSRLATMIAVFSFVFLIFTTAGQSATEIADKLPIYQARLWSAFYELEELAARVGLEELSTAGITQQLESISIAGTVSSFVGSVVTFVGNFVLIVVFTGFLVFGSDQLMGGGQDIADRVAAYVSIKSMMSLLTAALVFLLCLTFDIDFALFWATLAFLLNFVPSVGAIIASVPPVLLAVIQLDWSTALAFAGLLTAVHVSIGQVFEPKLMGDKLAVNPVAILLGLIFWGFLWGIPGMFLAAPLMALMRIYSSHYNVSRPLERLLAAE